MNPKTYEYALSRDASDWIEIKLSAYSDEFDAAEEAAEKLWFDSDGEEQEQLKDGLTLYIRDKESPETVFALRINTELLPSFDAQLIEEE